MKELKYIVGDVTEPVGDSSKLIIHIVNDQGVMGSGVAKALFEKWPIVREQYIKWYNYPIKDEYDFFLDIKLYPFKLGSLQMLRCEPDITVVNMVAQHMVGGDENGNPPIRYDALIECFRKIREINKNTNYSIHLPYKMGADRAGGDWYIIERIIQNELTNHDIDVTVYKLKG